MDLLILNLYLLVVYVPVLICLRLVRKGLMLSIASFLILALPEREREERSAAAAIAYIAVCMIAFCYCAVAWSAFCSVIAKSVASRPAVTWDWLYNAVGLIWCVQLLAREINPPELLRKVSTETRTVWDQTTYTFQSLLVITIAVSGFATLAWIIFAIWPSIALIPYGWILRPSVRWLEAADGFLKRNWWLPITVLVLALIRLVLVHIRTVPVVNGWAYELDRVVMMAKSLSSEWVGYNKEDFRNAILDSWSEVTAEDGGTYLLIRNERFSYFEFYFMFGEHPNARMTFLFVRGLKELQGLWILGQSGSLALSLKSEDESSIWLDAQKAANLLARKFKLQFTD